MDRFNEPISAAKLLREPFAGEPLTCECPHCGRKLLTMAGTWVQCDEEDPRRTIVEGLESACSCEAARVAAEDEKRAQRAAEELARKEREALRLEQLWGASGMPRGWRERGLASWVRETAAQEEAYQTARGYGQALRAKLLPRSLFIAGDIGTGKTFLASCLAADLVRRGHRVQWCNASGVLRDIRESFGNSRVSESEVLRRFTAPGTLVLDDLGKERPTEWALEQLFCILNERYDRQRPVIVTTNYGGEDLVRRLTPRPDVTGWVDDTTARAIVDRLRAMSNVIKLEGRSWR